MDSPTAVINVSNAELNNTFGALIYESAPTWTYALAIIMAILSLVGIIGNAAVVSVILWHPSMRNTPNALVACLAIGDLMFLFTSAPFKIYHTLMANWPFGEFVCKLSNGVIIISLSVSVFSLTALSYDRFKAIVTPMNYTQYNSTKIIYSIIVVIWILSIVLSLPTIVWSEHVDWGGGYYGCMFLDQHSLNAKIYESMRCLLLYVLPLTIISVFYTLVSRKLFRSTKAMPGEVHDKRAQIASRKRLAVMVLAIIVLFAVCWFPATIVTLLFQISPSVVMTMPMAFFRIAANMLAYSNSSLNPILLVIVSSNYRKHIGNCLCAIKPRKGKRLRKVGRSATFSSKVSIGMTPLVSVRTKVTEFPA
ncbi:gastrin-releasing peptide receptor-like [Amphiura filiformis]|uniref:gastrin-releasing peptide receptor-like n=1 Tax=Amphiura filiformis TaxID=82378 RepID=UPI003B21DC2B